MLKNKDFWEIEGDAALMKLNRGYLDSEENKKNCIERVSKWPSLVSNLRDEEGIDLSVYGDDYDFPRIIVKDADRTFTAEKHRIRLMKVLTFLNDEFKDYHQGMGFVASFLMMFLEDKSVISILRTLYYDDFYIPGFWRHEAIPFAIDAYVFDDLLKKYNPDVQAHLLKFHILPETYLQKWFTAFCIHVLEFEALFDFFELFLERGARFLMQFGIAFFKVLGDDVLKATNSASLYAYLRLDRTMVEIDNDISKEIFACVNDNELDEIKAIEDLVERRKKAYDENLRKRIEDKARAEAEEEEEEEEEYYDEEGMECELCEIMVPEYFCMDCNKYACGMCKGKSINGHIKDHKLVSADEAPSREAEKDLAEDLEKLEIK